MTAVVDRPAVTADVGPPMLPLAAGRLALTWGLLALSITAAWLVLFALVLSGLQGSHSQVKAYSQLREGLSQQTVPLGGRIAPGTPLALMNSRALGLRDVVMVEGTASGDLELGPGHRRDTVLPGQPGVAVVYGRARLFGGPFGQIIAAHKGDVVTVLTGQGTFSYVVDRVRHIGDPLPTLLAAGGSRLTLVTSGGASASRLWTGNQPVYVDATLKGKVAAGSAPPVALVPRSEQAMQGDASSLFVLVLWLPLLLMIAALLVGATTRWGAVQTWLVGAPLLVAALWGGSESAVELLPNLL